MPEERTTRHSHYNLNYHFVFTPKYRRHVFHGAVRERLMQVLRETCLMRDWIVLGMEIMPDHAHIFVSVPPKWSPSDVAKILKGVSARRILQEFPKLRRAKGGGHLWTPSFYVGSAGNISAQTIQRYIESQRKYQDDDA
ncbi:IS200/IS605 family transposase [Calidithermus chliarophilus]|uniref:IS200/IS605 family transposase n=1 Tax=Calidithermus chliarophilus TaxID=52023 RepID=UPI00056CA646|nr:IS200/IS605 family transposase [Calidithermus chliarophilus]